MKILMSKKMIKFLINEENTLIEGHKNRNFFKI